MIKNKLKRQTITITTLVVLLVLVALGLAYRQRATVPNPKGNLDSFAQCLKAKGVTFYGAFWCPHCQNQKTLFGSSVKYLPYVECSTPDANGQLQLCTDKNITGYPTWVFADGSRQSGELDLNTLAAKSGCIISQ